MKQRLMMVVLITGVVLLARGLLINSGNNASRLFVENDLVQPHQVEDIVLLRYNERGDPTYRLTAVSACYDRQRKTIDFHQPRLQLLAEQQQVIWSIEAKEACLVQQQLLCLQGSIKAMSLRPYTALQELQTEQLQLNLGDGSIMGSEWVQVNGKFWVSQGNGVKGNFHQYMITMLNSVRTIYDGQQ